MNTPAFLFKARSGANSLITLVDSGASECIITEEMAKRIGGKMKPAEKGSGFTCANDEVLMTVGMIEIPLSMQRYAGKTNAHVVAKLPDHLDLILGNDWLRKEKALIDYDKMLIRLKRYGCSILPINQVRSERPKSFFARARETAYEPTEETKISAKKAWRMMKKGMDYIMVNIRNSTSKPTPETPAMREELMKRAIPSDEKIPDPPPVELNLEQWMAVNIAEHKDESLIPAAELKTLLRKYEKVFNELPNAKDAEHIDRGIGHTIRLEANATPPYQKNRRMSPKELALCEQTIADLLKKGFIEPSNSPFGAPIMFIAKPSGGYRVVCDWRSLNNITIKNRYPLPRIDETVDRLGGAKIFSSLDLNSGYFQIRISDEDAHKTAFVTPSASMSSKY
jgi:hypothetical protein